MSIRNYLSESTLYTAYWITPTGKILDCGVRKHIDYVCDSPRKFGITEKELQNTYSKYGEPIGFEGVAREEILLSVIRKGFIRIRKYKNMWSINVSEYNRRVRKLLSNWAYEIIQNPKEDKYMDVNITADTGNPPTNITLLDLSGLIESHNIIQTTTLDEMKYLVETDFQQILNEIHEKDKTSYYRRIDEAGIARIVSTLKNNSIDFVLITAFRGKLSFKQNQQHNDQLLRDFRSALGNNKAYGAYRIIGHYDECNVVIPPDKSYSDCEELGGKMIPVLEETWCILNDQKNERFFDVAAQMAEKYDQDSFIARTSTNPFGLYSKDGSKIESFGSISNDTFFSGFVRLVGVRNYSEIKLARSRGRIFNMEFQAIEESLELGTHNPSDSISQKMLFYGMNLLR